MKYALGLPYLRLLLILFQAETIGWLDYSKHGGHGGDPVSEGGRIVHHFQGDDGPSRLSTQVSSSYFDGDCIQEHVSECSDFGWEETLDKQVSKS